MFRTLSSRSSAACALALSTLTAVALLGPPAQSIAQAHKPSCASPAHAAHGLHACILPRRVSKSAHKHSRAHAHPTTKGHHPRRVAATHRKATKRASVKRAAAPPAKSPSAAKPVPATCADGNRPTAAGSELFTCDDGSEPACEDGTYPAQSSNGSTLLCDAPGKPPAIEATCEDGSHPAPVGDEMFTCDDESEPTCEDGSEPTLSADGSALVCDVSGGETVR